MKKGFFLAIALLTGHLALGQFELGARAGVNLQRIKVDEFIGDNTYSEVLEGEREVGYHAGIYAKIDLVGFYIQPEAIFTQINNTFTFENGTQRPGELEVTFHRFDVPILAGIKLGPLRLNAGPVISFNLEEQHDAFEAGFRHGSWGYQAGVGLNIGKIRIDGRYEGPLSKSADAITFGEKTYALDARTSQIIIGVGVKLF